ncbi:MAG: hypothetical protein Q4B28_03785 [bacterium]|nr:hypothetical protein [bacterium]
MSKKTKSQNISLLKNTQLGSTSYFQTPIVGDHRMELAIVVSKAYCHYMHRNKHDYQESCIKYATHRQPNGVLRMVELTLKGLLRDLSRDKVKLGAFSYQHREQLAKMLQDSHLDRSLRYLLAWWILNLLLPNNEKRVCDEAFLVWTRKVSHIPDREILFSGKG